MVKQVMDKYNYFVSCQLSSEIVCMVIGFAYIANHYQQTNSTFNKFLVTIIPLEFAKSLRYCKIYRK